MPDRRYATIARAATEHGVTHHTVRNWISKGYFPVYRLPGQVGACVDLDEVAAALARLPAAKARPGFGSFGPDAIVRDLSNVAEQYEVLA
jgi:hypothetical protein